MANINLEEGDVVLCTVDRIEGTVVFVKIEPFEQTKSEGTIIMTELSSGRIRNIRDYVVPNKKIVCKILRLSQDRVDLSLRRVTNKEKKEVMEKFQHEKSYVSVLKSILKDKADKTISEISKTSSLYDFLEDSKEDSKKLESLVGKTDSTKIIEIISQQKKNKKIIKKEFNLSSLESNGLETIKSLLIKISTKEAQIKYLAAGKYTIEIESTDLKSADNKIREILENLEKDCKKMKCEFSIK
jgi:translation initiation factor 2 alpha subunit (eIF-2alpha)